LKTGRLILNLVGKNHYPTSEYSYFLTGFSIQPYLYLPSYGSKEIATLCRYQNFSLTFWNIPKTCREMGRPFSANDHPIILELACGRGEYTVGLSAMFPGKNFIGVDIKGNRIYIGAKKSLEAGISNAALSSHHRSPCCPTISPPVK
jgi:hypothetical protein